MDLTMIYERWWNKGRDSILSEKLQLNCEGFIKQVAIGRWRIQIKRSKPNCSRLIEIFCKLSSMAGLCIEAAIITPLFNYWSISGRWNRTNRLLLSVINFMDAVRFFTIFVSKHMARDVKWRENRKRRAVWQGKCPWVCHCATPFSGMLPWHELLMVTGRLAIQQQQEPVLPFFPPSKWRVLSEVKIKK